MQEDILSSLKARFDLLCDVSEQAGEDAQLREQNEQENFTIKTDPVHYLPVRFVALWPLSLPVLYYEDHLLLDCKMVSLVILALPSAG